MTRPSLRYWVWSAAAILIVGASLAACGPSKEAVCQGAPEHIVMVPATSISDLKTSQQLAASVAHQAVVRAANSCGQLSVGLQSNQPEADLELRSIEFEPAHERAYNRKPAQREMIRQGDEFTSTALLEPLKHIKATAGSPFFGALAKIGAEVKAHSGGRVTVLLLGDGIAVEPAPPGNDMVDFRRASVPVERLDRFVPLLKPLAESCVMLIGAGARSDLPAQRIRAAQQMLSTTLQKAKAGFVATRSRELPANCEGEQ